MARLLTLPLLAWLLGFVWFAATLPRPAAPGPADAIVVLTGGEGRIARGLALLAEGAARQMLVTGVDQGVRPGEFQAQFAVSDELMACCITLGFAALDTRGNARETARWVAERDYRSVRLVTSDWHMRRARIELASQLPASITIIPDAVRSQVSLQTLLIEYHKFLAAVMLRALE